MLKLTILKIFKIIWAAWRNSATVKGIAMSTIAFVELIKELAINNCVSALRIAAIYKNYKKSNE